MADHVNPLILVDGTCSAARMERYFRACGELLAVARRVDVDRVGAVILEAPALGLRGAYLLVAPSSAGAGTWVLGPGLEALSAFAARQVLPTEGDTGFYSLDFTDVSQVPGSMVEVARRHGFTQRGGADFPWMAKWSVTHEPQSPGDDDLKLVSVVCEALAAFLSGHQEDMAAGRTVAAVVDVVDLPETISVGVAWADLDHGWDDDDDDDAWLDAVEPDEDGDWGRDGWDEETLAAMGIGPVDKGAGKKPAAKKPAAKKPAAKKPAAKKPAAKKPAAKKPAAKKPAAKKPAAKNPRR
jgi:hypothetical protein